LSAAQPLWLIAPLAFIFGAIAGSFAATILVRWPKGESVVAGRSRCDACAIPLTPGRLVPIVSFLFQKGRCSSCGAAIDPRHFAIEMAAAIVAVIALLAHPLPLALVTAFLGFWLLLLAAIDLEHQWLPDHLTLPLIPLGLLAAWSGLGPSWQERAIGAAAGFAILSLIAWLYHRTRGREGMGGGDPKLFAAIGAWLGALHLPYVLLGAGLLGLAAVALMALRGETVTATSRLPLGTLLCVACWPTWLVVASPHLC
jgi:leader peptidase (prepilin peptidase)/N-methyltransferase